MTDDGDTTFEDELESARKLLDEESITAFYVGIVDEDETVDTTFAQITDNPQQEGLQALSLLSTHIRIIAKQTGVDLATVARDAAKLAGQLNELSPKELAAIKGDEEPSDDE